MLLFTSAATSGTAGIYGYGGSTLDGGEQGSVVHVDGEGAVTIAGLTLTGGRALTATSFGGLGGGGVLCDRAASTLAIEDVTISGNAGANANSRSRSATSAIALE